MGLAPLGPPNEPVSFFEGPEFACLRLCIFGPPRCASGDGPLPPRPGGGGIGLPDLEIGPGGGGIGFPDAETGGALGTRCSGVVFASEGFGLAAFTSSVEGLPVTALDDGFLELTTLASLIVGLLSVFSALLGGGFLELTDFVVFSVLLSFALSESFSVSDFGFAFSADFLVAIPSDIAFFRTLSACASTRLEL